ncbi:hypothetical protein WA026_001391 [Henosepilachna vigintioctopunctata]|uniref:Uncharacterized protein n=1 Tax=Henosepilachna vigintioctopunctata TaxID=420089 RepID=A0AAW1UUG3_9CUCU
MVAASVMVGTAATFFSLGGIFCLYIHSVSKTMRRAYSQELKCGESVENKVCCERDMDNTEFRCSREGLCGNKPKEKKQKDENESNVNILPQKELSLNEKTSNLSNDETLTKIDEYNTKIGLSKESLGSMEVEETKIGEESNTDIVNSKVLDLTKNEIDIEGDSKEEGLNFEEKKNSLIEKEKAALEQTNDREGEGIPQNQNPPKNKNEEKKRKREEKEAKKLQQKEMRKREKEDRKKMQQEKKKISKEKKNKKKEEKSLKINKKTHSTKKKSEQKNVMNDENEIEETTSYKEIEQANSCYQKIKAILESGRNKN